ncbi:MAG: MBL fold metallo-hydrolase [Fretibacterium sp.]|nr:MBL fold metallo-hydrolase [Fretibacterium sp.]
MQQLESFALFDQQNHHFIMLGWEEKEEGMAVQTNQYVVSSGREIVLLDPGGAHVFPRVLANVAELVDLKDIRHIFYSHQDPDVSSGITLWLSMAEKAIVHISELWVRFLPHFGVYDERRIVPIADAGGRLSLEGGNELLMIPSHFLHSTGCFSLYDPLSKILFTGDIGAALFPKGKRYPVVENFDSHLPYMEAFHRRYMASNAACRSWVRRVSSLDIEMIAPQHGAVIQGRENVKRFLDWFGGLRCGSDIVDQIYGH